MTRAITKERLAAFSDGIFAVIITIMVLHLKMPQKPTFGELLATWPTAASYLVSYFLWSFAKEPTPRFIFWNFAHMFAASLVPFATAWVAGTGMASVPVFVYAAVASSSSICHIMGSPTRSCHATRIRRTGARRLSVPRSR